MFATGHLLIEIGLKRLVRFHLLAEDSNFLEKLKAEVKQKTLEQQASRTPVTVQFASTPSSVNRT